MNPRVKLRHLSAFVEVARCCSVTRAARALCVTRAAVSKTLGELDEIMGAPLLKRDGRGVLLTPPGEVFLRHAEQGLAAIRRGEEAVALARRRGGFKIVLGALPSVAARIVPLAVREFMRENPAAVARVVIGGNSALLSMLKSEELDLLVGRLGMPKDMKDVNFERLYSERLALAARPGHPLLKERRSERRRSQRQILKEVGGHTVIFPSPETRMRDGVDRLFIQSGAPLPTRWVETNSTAFARGMVLEGDAVWCVQMGVVESDLQSGILKEIPADMGETLGAVGMSVCADSPSSPERLALMEKFREVAGEADGEKKMKV